MFADILLGRLIKESKSNESTIAIHVSNGKTFHISEKNYSQLCKLVDVNGSEGFAKFCRQHNDRKHRLTKLERDALLSRIYYTLDWMETHNIDFDE